MSEMRTRNKELFESEAKLQDNREQIDFLTHQIVGVSVHFALEHLLDEKCPAFFPEFSKAPNSTIEK